MIYLVISSAAKKTKAPPRTSQPWDEARRRQAAPPPVEPKWQKLPDAHPWEVPGDLDDVWDQAGEFTRDQVEPGPVPVADPAPEGPAPAVAPALALSPAGKDRSPVRLSFSPRALVQGVIMSEILQSPRAKRPIRCQVWGTSRNKIAGQGEKASGPLEEAGR